MIPRTTAQNLVLWGVAFAVAVLLSFLSGLATHWPESGDIEWRGVWLDVIQTILTTVPIIAAGLGLPTLGKEAVTHLASQVGTGQATAALEVEAVKQATGLPPTVPATFSTDQVDQISRRILELRDERAADRLRKAQEHPNALTQPLPPTPRYG